jgi:hypothetical protein
MGRAERLGEGAAARVERGIAGLERDAERQQGFRQVAAVEIEIGVGLADRPLEEVANRGRTTFPFLWYSEPYGDVRSE